MQILMILQTLWMATNQHLRLKYIKHISIVPLRLYDLRMVLSLLTNQLFLVIENLWIEPGGLQLFDCFDMPPNGNANVATDTHHKRNLLCFKKLYHISATSDGDRIMAVYIGDSKNTSAARSALKINYTVTEIINPLLKKYYPATDYRVRQVVGIDTSELFVARTGIRGSNDLVWVGRAANYAAKLCSLSADYPSQLTEAVYNKLPESVKYSDGKPMWEAATWNDMNGMRIYRSTWRWRI